MEFLTINPAVDTPLNLIAAFILFILAVGSSIYFSKQNKKTN